LPRRSPPRGVMSTSPAVGNRGPQVTFRGREKRITTPSTPSTHRAPWHDARARGRSRAAQERHVACRHGIVAADAGRDRGRVRFEGIDLLTLSDRTMRDLRGAASPWWFQEPMTSLNPSYTIGEQIIEAVVRHRGLSRRDARRTRSRCCGESRCLRPSSGSTTNRAGCPAACVRGDIAMARVLRYRRLLIPDEPTHRARTSHPGTDLGSPARAESTARTC